MVDILDQISELVYVTDLETYDLLYMNQAGKDFYQLDQVKGLKCYKVLQGEQVPCAFCKNKNLKSNSIYTWEHFNAVLKRHFLLKDTLIDWNGKQAHVEIAFDVNEQTKERENLKMTLDAEKFLVDCVKSMYEVDDLNYAITSLLSLLNTYFNADSTHIVLYNEADWDVYTFENSEYDLHKMKGIPSDEWKKLLLDQQIVMISDVATFVQNHPIVAQEVLHQSITSMAIGAIIQNGRLCGYIQVENPQELTGFQLIFKTISYFLLISIRRWNDGKLLKKMSYYDSLTGLRNRNCYNTDVKNFMKLTSNVGVIYLDLNGLKDINDKFGHMKGDQTLIECTQTLVAIFAQDAYIYRLGGDEFAVINQGISEELFTKQLAELRKQLEVDTSFKAAFGYVWANSSEHLNELLSAADFKMYEDKKRYYRRNIGGNRYRHYHDDVLELAELKTLQERIKNHSFTVYLQPKFSFHDQSLIGSEALVRYHSPDGKLLSPGAFLPLLEDYNLIGNLDFYVFEDICKLQRRWLDEGKNIVPISTNFSRYSLLDKDFIEHLNGIIDHFGVEKQYVEIEITETVEGLEWFDMIQRIEEIRSAGFKLCIDDFGAHYANLSLFTAIEFNVLKIDKSLIDNIVSNTRAQSVISSIVQICKSMDVHIIVEGIETIAQFDVLKRLGCEGIQGYLFSKPITVEEYEMKYYQSVI